MFEGFVITPYLVLSFLESFLVFAIILLRKRDLFVITTFFLKKAKGILQSLPSAHPSIHPSVMLSPPKALDVTQPKLVCELLT